MREAGEEKEDVEAERHPSSVEFAAGRGRFNSLRKLWRPPAPPAPPSPRIYIHMSLRLREEYISSTEDAAATE